MAAPQAPFNLTCLAGLCGTDRLRKVDGGEFDGRQVQTLLSRPDLRCDRLDAATAPEVTAGVASTTQLLIVLEGYGGWRGADGDVRGITAGDVLYVEAGTEWGLEGRSRRFLALRLTLLDSHGD